jgi:hypothetical protein
VSTPARYAEAVVQPEAVTSPAAASTALVRITDERGYQPAPARTEKPVNAHWFFYGMGYTGLALIWAALWLNGFTGERFLGVGIMGVMFVGLGGFGVVIHTLYRPNERKVRHLLLALASLALTGAAAVPIERISREMYATAAVHRLQPLADALAKDARIREIGVAPTAVVLNGFYGPDYDAAAVGERVQVLDDVLARDGISREEYQAYQRALSAAGMDRAQRSASGVAFSPVGHDNPWLLYVFPGHALPPAHALMDNGGSRQAYHSQPLGGPWYMVLRGSR